MTLGTRPSLRLRTRSHESAPLNAATRLTPFSSYRSYFRVGRGQQICRPPDELVALWRRPPPSEVTRKSSTPCTRGVSLTTFAASARASSREDNGCTAASCVSHKRFQAFRSQQDAGSTLGHGLRLAGRARERRYWTPLLAGILPEQVPDLD